jgi:hypothetical protein
LGYTSFETNIRTTKKDQKLPYESTTDLMFVHKRYATCDAKMFVCINYKMLYLSNCNCNPMEDKREKSLFGKASY